MAEGKKSFVAYADWESQINFLTDEEAGKLFRHLLDYVNDREPEFNKDERLLKIAFEPIKQQLKRDLRKYESIKEKRSEAGKKGASTKQSQAKEANASFDNQTETNQAVNDNVNVNVTTNVVDIGDYGKKVLDGSYSEDPKYLNTLSENLDVMKTYDSWKTQVAKANSIELKDVPIWLDKFKDHILTQGKVDVSVNELKKHFSSWLRLRIRAGDTLPKQMTPQEKRKAISKSFNTN